MRGDYHRLISFFHSVEELETHLIHIDADNLS